MVKALGEGLGFPLASFSIPFQSQSKEVVLKNRASPQTWYLENLDLFPGYQAAYATHKIITHLSYYEWTPLGEKNWQPQSLDNENR